MIEERLERRLRDAVKRAGGQARKFTSPGWAGAPDRLVLLPGARTIFVELKTPGQRPRPLQARRRRELQALGFEVYVVSTATELEQFFAKVITS